MVDKINEMFLKDRQIYLLEQFVNGDLKETLLGDILSDSLSMLRKQLMSDFSWGDFRNYAEEIGQLKNDIIALQNAKNNLLIQVKDLESDADKFRMYSDDARKDVEQLKSRLAKVLDS